MVKGISKRVIVVKKPGNGVFEQAIFIVGGDSDASGCSADDIIREACLTAERFLKNVPEKKPFYRSIPSPMFAVFGAFVTAVVWAVTSLI